MDFFFILYNTQNWIYSFRSLNTHTKKNRTNTVISEQGLMNNTANSLDVKQLKFWYSTAMTCTPFHFCVCHGRTAIIITLFLLSVVLLFSLALQNGKLMVFFPILLFTAIPSGVITSAILPGVLKQEVLLLKAALPILRKDLTTFMTVHGSFIAIACCIFMVENVLFWMISLLLIL